MEDASVASNSEAEALDPVENIRAAATAIAQANTLLITAGAGMGKDSGLPT
jgi:hypothetical protein